MTEYKFRAESFYDVCRLVNKLSDAGIAMWIKHIKGDEIGLPDMEVEMSINAGIERVRIAIRDIEDSHVILQTIQPLALYTGERDIDII